MFDQAKHSDRLFHEGKSTLPPSLETAALMLLSPPGLTAKEPLPATPTSPINGSKLSVLTPPLRPEADPTRSPLAAPSGYDARSSLTDRSIRPQLLSWAASTRDSLSTRVLVYASSNALNSSTTLSRSISEKRSKFEQLHTHECIRVIVLMR